MKHAKGQRVCLLCHLAAQPDEGVVVSFDGAMLTQQPLFRPYKDVLCSKTPCYLCRTGRVPSVAFIHRDCALYRRKFSLRKQLRLSDILKSWPRAPSPFELSSKRNRMREREAFKRYLCDVVALQPRVFMKGEVKGLLTGLAKLPNELLTEIADISWPCALQRPITILAELESIEGFLESKYNSSDCLKYAGERVSVQSLTLYGISYIAGLTVNMQQDEGKIHLGCQDNLQPIVITRDELGVRDVRFCGGIPAPQRGCWYKVIRPRKESKQMCLDICSEYVVTSLRLDHDDMELYWDTFWDRPLLVAANIHAWYTIKESACPPKFMRYVALSNNVQGITVSCGAEGIISIHAHTHKEVTNFYEEVEGEISVGVAWIYLPLAENETITAGWIRELDTTLNVRHPTLVLRTSLCKTCTFGPYVPLESRDRYRFQWLGSHPVTGVCYNDMGMASTSQFRLGLTCDVQGTNNCEPTEPSFGGIHVLPESTIPEWFRSSASLDGANRVRRCVDNEKSHMPTIGMLLVYADREELLGQWRYDRQIEEIELTERMYVFSGKTTAGPFVRIVGNGEQKEDWREITRTATIVWWFNSKCSLLEISTAA